MKKSIMALLLGGVLLSFGGCKPAMNKAFEGKDGLFAVIETANGNISLELFYKETPLTVTNFVGLAEGTLDAAKGKPFYNGLKFHRVISKANGDDQDFMIQGGDPKGNGSGGPGYKFPDEIVDSLKFDKPGYLAMANAGAGTNGSQFFITIVPTPWLTGHHTIFGKVVDAESQKVVNTLKANTIMKSVTIYRQGADAQKFKATQADFNRILKEMTEKEEAEIAAYVEAQLDAIKKNFSDFTRDGKTGIYYKITKEGAGAKTGSFKKVSMHYKGSFLNGEVFDQSRGRGPLEFTTSDGRMIKGFDVTVQDMKVGEKRTVILPPEYAYGDRGAGDVIPPKTYLVFEIELLDAK
ncbi:MAG: peptidylprolyl isomerase [Treponema sp.]|nr:peptidylprolyl isomerase [Treponema sp.]